MHARVELRKNQRGRTFSSHVRDLRIVNSSNYHQKRADQEHAASNICCLLSGQINGNSTMPCLYQKRHMMCYFLVLN